MYSSPIIIKMIKLKRMRGAGHVAPMEENRNACRVLIGKPEGKRNHWKDVDIDGRRILKMDLWAIGWRGCGLDSFGS
jgi:hypothetical protein